MLDNMISLDLTANRPLSKCLSLERVTNIKNSDLQKNYSFTFYEAINHTMEQKNLKSGQLFYDKMITNVNIANFPMLNSLIRLVLLSFDQVNLFYTCVLDIILSTI